MLAVIPARGGSKGVPSKNIRKLAGKPLIAYTIEEALHSDIFEKVIVSTDSQKIACIAEEYGAEVPFIRPEEISGDMASSDDVVLHALDFYRQKGIEFNSVCKLQPTSPLRTAEHIKRACRQELPLFYRLNGVIYMGKTKSFYENKSFLGKNGFAYIMKQESSVDIDSEWDFKIAEYLVKGENRR